MIDWISKEWDKLLGVLLTIAGFAYAFVRRIWKLETRVDGHIASDRSRNESIDDKLDTLTGDISEMKLTITKHDVLLSQLGEDVREMRSDIKKLLERV